MDLLERYLKHLSEGYQQSTVRRSKQDKIRSSTGAIAVSMGKRSNDPIFKKMIFHKTMYLKLKEQLERKYKSKSLQRARMLASSSR